MPAVQLGPLQIATFHVLLTLLHQLAESQNKDVILPPLVATAAPKDSTKLVPTAETAAVHQMAQRNLAEAPAALAPSFASPFANASEPVNTLPATFVSQPNAVITTDDGTTQKTTFVPVQQYDPITRDLALFLTTAGAAAAIVVLCCVGGAIVFRIHTRRQACTYWNL